MIFEWDPNAHTVQKYRIAEKIHGRIFCDCVLKQAFCNLRVDILRLCFDINNFANKLHKLNQIAKKRKILTS